MNGTIAQLVQLCEANAGQQAVWDGNLISKSDRDVLVKAGWVVRCAGYNMPTLEGQKVYGVLKLGEEALKLSEEKETSPSLRIMGEDEEMLDA